MNSPAENIASETLLSISNLCKSFGGVRAVVDVTFDLKKGELLGIIGPNGSGKTTLVNLITGFVKPDSGAVVYRGKTITQIIAFGAGGMYGLNGRIMSKHIGEHIPGNPNIIVKHMSGAGGSKAANYMYKAAPQDGSHIAELSKDIAVAKVMRPKKLAYEPQKFDYLGSDREGGGRASRRSDMHEQIFWEEE